MSFLTNIFGKTKVQPAQVGDTMSGFSGGGLTATVPRAGTLNPYTVTADPNRTGIVGDLADTFGTLGNKLGGLAATVAPGFNDLLSARLTALNNAKDSALGNLRENLQARRVLGSSFGQDTLTRANATFGQQRDAIVADNFMKSLEASNQLITQQYGAYAKQFQTGLDELNLEAGLASNLQNNGNQILAQNAQAQAKLNQDAATLNAKMSQAQASGFGNFLGRIALAPFSGGASLALPSFGQGNNWLSTDTANNGGGIYTGPAWAPGFG